MPTKNQEEKTSSQIFSVLMSSSITGLWRGLIGLPF